MSDPHAVAELKARGKAQDWDAVIGGLAERIDADRLALADPWVKKWCGRRYRDLFLSEASRDAAAVRAASKRVAVPGTDLSLRIGKDTRPDRRRIAERFLHRDQGDWKLELPEVSPRAIRSALVFCPGLVNTFVPVPGLGPELAAVERDHGWRVVVARSHPVRGCEGNVGDLVDAVERGKGLRASGEPTPRGSRGPKRSVLIGYSKGSPDAVTMLALRPELSERVAALVGWAGAFGGSYIADGLYGSVEDMDLSFGGAASHFEALIRVLLPIAKLDRLAERFDEYDIKGAIRDLTTTERARFWREHRAGFDASGVPVLNLATVAAPLEVPYFQMQGSIDIGRAAGDNDMQLSVAQSRLKTPLATNLAVFHGHHWDIAYGPFPKRFRLGAANLEHTFPRRAALTAVVLLLAELGLVG